MASEGSEHRDLKHYAYKINTDITLRNDHIMQVVSPLPRFIAPIEYSYAHVFNKNLKKKSKAVVPGFWEPLPRVLLQLVA